MQSIIPNISESDLVFKEEIEEYLSKEVAPHLDYIEQGKIDIWDVIRLNFIENIIPIKKKRRKKTRT